MKFFPSPEELRVVEMGDGCYRLQQSNKVAGVVVWTNVLVSWSLPQILSYRLTVLGDETHDKLRSEIKTIIEVPA